jgi:hypothetical protein
MESAEFESSLIAELNRLLLQAAEELESEERLDLAYEVLETVRFEQSHTSWIDRLRNTSGEVELRLAHSQLPIASGFVKHLVDPFVILENSANQFFINFEFVVCIGGISKLSQKVTKPDGINWLDNIWFHDLIEHRHSSTWFLIGEQVIEGRCIQTGFDSLDIEACSKIFTVPKRSIIAIRTSKSS